MPLIASMVPASTSRLTAVALGHHRTPRVSIGKPMAHCHKLKSQTWVTFKVPRSAQVGSPAWVTCGIRFMETEDSNQRAAAVFLAYVGLLAMYTSWNGLRALRFKHRTEPHYHLLEIGIPFLLILGG